MEDYPTFRDFYEQELINSDPREFMDLIPAKKQTEIKSLLEEYNIPEDYHFFFYAFYQIVIPLHNNKNKENVRDLIKVLEFFEILKHQSVKEITIHTKGKSEDSGEYLQGDVILKDANPFLKKIADLLKEFGKQNDAVLKTYAILGNQSKRGAKIKPTTLTLKWLVPEAVQLLKDFGIKRSKMRTDFLGKMLVLAGILEPTPPFSYKDLSSYFHFRIKQYY